MPKISIITPVYADISHKVDWLNEMIGSVTAQTIDDWEIIIINDKSPVSVILNEEYENDSRIRIFETDKNYGPPMARNTAVSLAESDCILPVDADDLLATPDVLEYMYDTWIMDKSKVIYGNLQEYVNQGNNKYLPGKIHQLGQFSCEAVKNTQGLFPVTAMHSKSCFEKIGGWKTELNDGLEDVEYWVNASIHGFCGHKINTITLLYRRHESSRAFVLKHGNPEKNIPVLFEDMQRKIIDIHNKFYKGEAVMSCCGQGASTAQTQTQTQMMTSQQSSYVTTLEGYDEKDLEWVKYNGPRQGFDIHIRNIPGTPNKYRVEGAGHTFQIHIKHKQRFEQLQRQGFQANAQDPRPHQRIEEPAPMKNPEPSPTVTRLTSPELATILRLDNVAMESPTIDAVIQPVAVISFADLGFGEAISGMLKDEFDDINTLANASLPKLMTLPGIGEIRAKQIIDKAKELIQAT